jgi:Spy/CpxP family protein refolding chaperone
MKKLMIILFLATLGMNAQDRKFEEIKAHKTAFITEQVNLTSTQAEKFWPIYNKHEQEVMALRKTQLEGFKTLRNKNVDDLSEAKAKAMLLKHGQVKAQLTKKMVQLISLLEGVITPQQTIKLLMAEEGFKKRLLKHFRGRNQNRKDKP